MSCSTVSPFLSTAERPTGLSCEAVAALSSATGSTSEVYIPRLPALIRRVRSIDGDVSLLDPSSLLQTSPQQAVDTGSPFSRSRSCESVWVMLNYGVTAEQGTRKTMEDQHTMLAEGIPFFGVYDGHGGTQCAEYLRDNLHTLILSHPEIKTNPEKAIMDGFATAEERFLAKCMAEKVESGSVCAVALFVRGNLVVGNVGDCEVVLCRGGAAVPLTVPHNPRRNAAEAARVVAAGGRVFRDRVAHPRFHPAAVSLAVSRAFGDAGFKLDEYTDGKRSGIIAVPDTKSIRLTAEDEFLIIGCDGLWDVMSYEEVIAFCGSRFRSGCDPKQITERLVDEALSKGATDNVTVAFVSCQPIGQPPGSGPASATASATAHQMLLTPASSPTSRKGTFFTTNTGSPQCSNLPMTTVMTNDV